MQLQGIRSLGLITPAYPESPRLFAYHTDTQSIGQNRKMLKIRAGAPVHSNSFEHLNTLFDRLRAERTPAKFAAILHVLFQFAGIFE